jgi:two-component system, LytTR family, response regulator
MIRALIVDDEPLAREWVRSRLAEDPEIEIAGEAEDGFSAALAIQERDPDLVFLDVQMPGVDGFGVLAMLQGEREPVVVFVTAFDRYAVHAFDVNAVDYLVKPFSRERFETALSRAKARLAAGPAERTGSERLLNDLRGRGRYLEWLLVKTGERSHFVKARDIDVVDAAKNNVLLQVGEKEYVFTSTMKALEEALDPAVFLRIHRSTIVNIERVKELQPWFNGEYRVVLKSGKERTLSATYRPGLSRFRRLPA